MELDFFQKQCKRLRDVYPSGMSEERAKLIWAKFRNAPDHVFENAINHLISEHTTQTLPALSKFAEAVGMFRTGTSAHINHAPPAFDCEPCRDFGFGWAGETIVACSTCETGRRISPQELARQQNNYDNGKRLFMDPKRFPNVGTTLPYDPSVRFT